MMTYQRMTDTLHGRTIRCGSCKGRHAFVRDVRACYEDAETLAELAAESQASYIQEALFEEVAGEDHTAERSGFPDGPVWSNYGGWVA